MVRVVVIGAGVCGVSAACNIQRLVPGAEVTIVAEKFSPNTTSDVAAGIWEPHCAAETPEWLQKKWGDDTFEHLEKLYRSEDAGECGVSFITGYALKGEEEPEPFWKSTVYGFRQMTDRELSLYPGHSFGFTFTTYLCEGRYYLPYLMKRFKQNGGRVFQRKVNNLDEVYNEADVVVNCAGIGSYHMVGDKKMHPIRGQLLTCKAPWIKFFLFSECGGYQIFPGRDSTLIGGIHQDGDWSLEPKQKDTDYILEGCTKLMPSLKGIEITGTRVGLRPARPSVRLELEWRKYGDRSIPVVHNYGHGGCGVTLHWGCALDAVELVKQAVAKQQPVSKHPIPKAKL